MGKECSMMEVNIGMVSDRASYPPGLRGVDGGGVGGRTGVGKEAGRREEQEKCS